MGRAVWLANLKKLDKDCSQHSRVHLDHISLCQPGLLKASIMTLNVTTYSTWLCIQEEL